MFKNKKIKKFFIFFSAVLIIFFAVDFLSDRYNHQRLEDFTQRIEQQVNPVVEDFKVNCSFSVASLENKILHYGFNSQQKFAAASLIKIPIMAAVLKADQEEKLKLSSVIIITKKDICPGSGIIKKAKLPFKTTVYKLLEIMIANSDNTATNKIIDLLGFDYINKSFQEFGCLDTVLKRRMMDFKARSKGIENYTTCRDMTNLLAQIYKKELINETACETMLDFLKKQKINDRLPKYLPETVKVAHKTGLERNSVGDVGIVLNSHDYVISVIVADFPSYRQAKEVIAKLSMHVYNVFEQLKK